MDKAISETSAESAQLRKDEAARVVLGASCTIHEAQAIKSQLVECLSASGARELDGRSIERVDTTGVQLLVAFSLDCMERNFHFAWTGRSAALEEAIGILGVAALLESPGAAASYSPSAG